jgi:outer membrane protein assembly factor BamB
MDNAKIYILVIMLIPMACESQNVSQWRGQDRNGSYYENGLLDSWPEDGPDLLWSAEGVGDGYSSVSVTNNLVYITGKEDSLEFLTAIDHSGNIQWKIPYGKAWNGGYPAAKTTPNVHQGKVYVISGQGEVVCLDAANGNIIWKVPVYEEFEGYATMWGVCESPLIVDNKVFYMPGGNKTTMVALNINSGEIVWESECVGDSTAYVSPIYFEFKGQKTVVTLSANYLMGFNPENGNILWKYKYYDLKGGITHQYHPIINTNSPYYHDGQIYITKGYNHLAAMFGLNDNGTGVELLWTDSILDVHHGGVVMVDGYVYGANTLGGRNSNWCCLEWSSGNIMYESELLGRGSVITADGKIYFYKESNGEVALIDASPKGSKIVSKFKVPLGNGPHWAHPVINDRILYIRHGDAVMAYNIDGR